MVVHLEHAPTTRGAVVRAVWLAGLAFFAEPYLAVAFDGEGRGGWVVTRGCREEAVAGAVCRRPGVGEDGGGVGPV